MGHFGREWHRERSKDNRNWNQGSSSKAVKIEDASEKAMYAIDGAGFDWSDMVEEEIQANMALMAFSDSEYDNLLVKLDDTGFKASTYKSGLSILEGQNFKYKESEILFSEEIALLKRSVGHKEYLIGLLRTELEKVKEEKEGFEFKIAKFEKSAKDLDQLLARGGVSFEEFKQPEVNEYGPRDSSLKPTTGCDKESDNSKENINDSLKQQQKIDSKTSSVKTFMKESVSSKAVLMKTGLKSVNTARPVNTVRSVNTGRPFSTARQRFNTGRQNVNTVKARRFNAVKPSACWVWRPIKPNGASLVFNKYNYIDLNDKGFVDSGCSRHMTGNITHLSDFKDFDGGYVTFGGGAYGGRITGKGIEVLEMIEKSKKTYSSAFTKLILRVKKLEARVKIGKARRRAKVVLSEDDKDVEDDSSKQWKKLTDAEVQEKASTASEVLVVSTAEENLSTARRTITYRRRSEEKRIRKDKGKAIMTEETNARDEEIARQWDEEERQRAMAEAKLTKKIDWNDPSVIRLVKERYSASRPEGYDYLSFGDECKLYKRKMKSDGKWKIQHEYNRDKLEFI
ncbi:hypothetical protein Tco_0801321 [Tanacetum coccineum]|uniref:Uncharacterized protein n=1 Tax=Tanacetum coccineum TaxID=301880 RepID=A0ABQ4ZZV0_9ASTR